MKRIIILIAITVFTVFAANAQIDSLQHVYFTLPTNSIRITESNLNLNEEKDKDLKIYDYLYRIGNFNLGVKSVLRQYFPPYYLEKKKKFSFDYLNQSVGLIDRLQYTSRIEKVNDIKVLISQEFSTGNYFDYHMSIMNESNTMWFTAAITFVNESDKAAATQLMYDFLNSIVFDDPQNVPCSIITPDPFHPDEVCRDCDCLEDCDSLAKTFRQKGH